MSGPLARLISAESRDDLALALERMALPEGRVGRLVEERPWATVLVTRLSRDEVHFLERVTREGGMPELLPSDVRLEPPAALLTGTRAQLDRLLTRAHANPEQHALAVAIAEALRGGVAGRRLALGGRTLPLGEHTYVMAVLNVTPDSFSDGGQFAALDAAVAHAEALIAAGADILDVGGESTRPGAEVVGVDEELSRVIPVIRAVRERSDIPISIDTTKAAVAREALKAGASMVNDISGLTFDEGLAPVIAETGAACCLMHIRQTPRTMQLNPTYDDVVQEVVDSLRAAIGRAMAAGVAHDRLIVDPGIGFGKTAGHNLFLMRRLGDLRVLGCPVLVGPSRKSFLGHVTRRAAPSDRLAGTLAAVSFAALMGVDVVRVHDVAEARDAIAVTRAIAQAHEGGAAYVWNDEV